MPERPPPWRPLLDGEAAVRAREAAAAIARALHPAAAPGADVRTAATLGSGLAGHALFFDYAARVLQDGAASAAAAELCLDQAIAALAAQPLGFGLYGGFTGTAWVAEHLARRAGRPADGEEEDGNEEIDAVLADLVTRSPFEESYDLIGGLVGIGVYALERLPRPGARALLAAVVDRLDELAVRGPAGITWFTPPELMGPWARERNPAGHYNLGVAHGVPGILPLLAAAGQAGVRAARARLLLEGGFAWLLGQWDRGGAGACFVDAVGPGVAPRPSRLAWCYGDAGIAAALLSAARRAGRPDWEGEAHAVALRAAARPGAETGVHDAGLCHGAFGLVHLFNRLYQATGDDRLAAAARLWCERGLGLRRPGEGVAGFAAFDPTPEGVPRWAAETGFLTGAAGIGLALLAASAAEEPAWDRVLLADIPLA